MDAVYVLGPAGDRCLDAGFIELLFQHADDLLDVGLALGPLGAQQLRYFPVRLGVDVLEGQVLEEPLDLPDAETVGERRVDFEGLLCYLFSPLFRQRVERPHVMESVGELYQHDPDVLGDGHQHLAQSCGLGVIDRVAVGLLEGVQELGLGQLGDAVDQLSDLFAETAVQVVEGDLGVFDDVV